MAKAIMIQGAGSNVGKSIIVAGLARAMTKRGLKVVPFKPQNMSNNAAVAANGGEIGRAQALQARAAGVPPVTDMNPVLLKPESDRGAQVIVQGQMTGTLHARDWGKMKSTLLPVVLESFRRLTKRADIVLIEGAGSPAEVNLREGDIANMGFAEAADVPVILIGDIDRGGVIAQCVGTYAVLPKADRDRIKAFAINKFRGDTQLFESGMQAITDQTGWIGLGILPWFDAARKLPAEDILDLRSSDRGGDTIIAVPRLGRIANFDDLDPLATTDGVDLRIIEPGYPLPGDAKLVLLPGSKTTISDMHDFRAQGWDIDLAAHLRRGGHVLGLCGGYQMLGRRIEDPMGIEGTAGGVDGLGLLDVTTTLGPEKRVQETSARHVESGLDVAGYEIHLGVTEGPDRARPWLHIGDRPEGASSADGRVAGCYLHRVFGRDAFREWYLQELGVPAGKGNYEAGVDAALDSLAAHLEVNLDITKILALAQKVRTKDDH